MEPKDKRPNDSPSSEESRPNNDFGNKVHPRITKRLQGYRFWSAALMIVFVLLGIISVISALIAATYTDALSQGIWLKVLILVSAASSTLITSFNLQGKAKDVWRAFRHLEQAILKFELDDSYDSSKLLAAYKEAENMVGFFEFNDQKGQHNV